jgi:hypothetical protein
MPLNLIRRLVKGARLTSNDHDHNLDVLEAAIEDIALTPGNDGREIQLQSGETHIQWRYVGDAAWTNLVALSELTGADGREVELQASATHIQWRYSGTASWTNLVALSEIAGGGADAVQPRHFVKDIAKVLTLDFCREELEQYVNISVTTTDSRVSSMADEDIGIEPLQAGTQYRGLSDVVSLSGLTIYPWTEGAPEDDSSGRDVWVPKLFASCEMVPDGTLDWEQGIQDGEILVNNEQLLTYVGTIKDWEPNTQYRGWDRILVDLPEELKAYYTGDSEAELYTLSIATRSGTSSSGEGASPETDELFHYMYGPDGASAYHIVVHLWDDNTDQVNLQIFDTGFFQTLFQDPDADFDDLYSSTNRVQNTRHYVVKEVDGEKTLWAATWHKTQSFSYSQLPEPIFWEDRVALIGNVLWFWEGFSRSQVFVAPPFRLSIPDGASIRYTTHAGHHDYVSGSAVVRMLETSNDRNESLETSGNAGGGEGLTLYWHRRQCAWTYENT